jgi:hypothetical protein
MFNLANAVGTRFKGNTIPSGTVVKVAGSSSVASTATFTSQSRITLQLPDSFATARFEDSTGAIFDPDEALFTTATPTLSSLSLNSAAIGGATTVLRRKLYAKPSSGQVLAQPTTWLTSGDRTKVWKARASGSSISVRYTVGDLAPGTSYTVLKGTSAIGTFTADSTGRFSFTNTAGTTSEVTFTVRP